MQYLDTFDMQYLDTNNNHWLYSPEPMDPLNVTCSQAPKFTQVQSSSTDSWL